MKYIVMIALMFIVLACDETEWRAQSTLKAHQWMIDNNLKGTVSCNHPNANYCDFIPADPRPPIVLRCYEACSVYVQ
jgi:hypothetical protein